MSDEPIRWLHVSDFHTGKDSYGQERLFKYILGDIESRLGKGSKPHFVFITGDIADRGQAAEYEDFAENFLFPLVDLLGDDFRERIFTIPGNHDVDRAAARAAWRYDILRDVPELLEPTPRGLDVRRDYLPRFKAFMDYDFSGAGGEWISSPAGVLTRQFRIGDHTIGVLALNTAWLSGSDRDRNQLYIGKGMVESGLDAIQDCDVRIVLGHHPLGWIADDEARMIRSLFGKYSVIYLHGHLHRSEARNTDAGGSSFLAVQAGASFQANEDELWVNRFLWGELSLSAGELRVEPLRWSRDLQEWVLDTDAFSPRLFSSSHPNRYVLPLSNASAPPAAQARGVELRDELRVARGWALIDQAFLEGERHAMSESQVLSFFDGRIPQWGEALAPEIPRREIVGVLKRKLVEARKVGRTPVTLVKGPGGEGKSTVLRQCIADLVSEDPSWHVLWHNHPEQPLPEDWLPPEVDGAWLIASDDADLISESMFRAVQQLRASERQDIQFLLCCRDTDWLAARADQLEWYRYTEMEEVALRGLSRGDAEQIVSAWSRYERKGLGRLAGLESDEAAARLLDAAREEFSDTGEGAFLGAMLRTRFGEDLRGHVAVLLKRLSDRCAPGDAETLAHAFAYIAVPHAENVLILSKAILAKALDCKIGEVRSKITGPLGEEAAAAMHGPFVLTRHRAIAEAAIEILSTSFHMDTEEIMVELLTAAVRLRPTTIIPHYPEWNALPDTFFARGKQDLAIRLAQARVHEEPNNAHYIVTLARIVREAGHPEQSVNIFREHRTGLQDRPFYHEWGTAEGNIGNYAVSVVLLTIGLADGTGKGPLGSDRPGFGLNGLSIAFKLLFENSADPVFLSACGAAAELGLALTSNPVTRSSLHRNAEWARSLGVAAIPLPDALENLMKGFREAWQQREINLPSWSPEAEDLTFDRLTRMLRLADR